jgi:dienelactone hydrolase
MKYQIALLVWMSILGARIAVHAQDGVALSRATLAARVAEIERANDLSSYRDEQGWSEEQPALRGQLEEMLGLPPLESRDPDLRVQITGTEETDQIAVDKLHFQSMPGLYVTGNLYRPKQLSGRLPAVLHVCGHGQVKQDGVSLGNKTYYQHHPAWFAEHGYICLSIDTIQLGEIEGIHHGLYSFNRWDWPSRGYTPAGVEAWNALRAVDYLITRPDVDSSKIGITGRSGGGAYSWYAAAIDPRISVSVPVAGITDLRDHVVGQCVRGHCDCMFMVNRYGWDYSMLAAMVFPRPLLIANTDKDPIFPLDGVERVHYQVRHVYHHGYKENLGIQWTTGGHDDTQELQLGCFVWFDHFLRGQRRVITKPAEPRFERSKLRVLESIPSDQHVTDVQEWFVPLAAHAIPKDVAEWNRMCREWTEEISGSVHGRVPFGDLERVRPALPLATSPVFEASVLDLVVKCYDVNVPPASKVRIVQFAREGTAGPTRVRVLVADESKWEFAKQLSVPSEKKPTADELSRLSQEGHFGDQDTDALWVFPEGRGPWSWAGLGSDKDLLHLKRSYLLCGWSLEGRQIAGVVRALELAKMQFPQSDVALISESETGMLALHAALLSPFTLEQVQLRGLPSSYRDGFVLAGILRKCDVSQVLATVATRHRTSTDRDSKVDLGYVRQMVKLEGRELLTLPDPTSRDNSNK